MRNQAEIETLKDELDELSEKALELPPEVYEQIKELHYFQLNVVDALTWVLEQEKGTTEVFRSPQMLGVDEMQKVIEAN